MPAALGGDDRDVPWSGRDFQPLALGVNLVEVGFRAAHPQIPRKRIVAFRSVPIHTYYRLETENVLQPRMPCGR